MQSRYPQTSYAPPAAAPQPIQRPAPPPSAARDGLLRQTDGPRLFAFAVIALVSGGLLAYPAYDYLDAWTFSLAGAIILGTFVALVFSDTYMRSGYPFRRMELNMQMRAEREAREAVDEGHTARLNSLNERLDSLAAEIQRLRTVKVSDVKGARNVPLYGPEQEEAIRFVQWMFTPLPNGEPQGFHPASKQLRNRYPFGGKDERSQAVDGILRRAGIIHQSGATPNHKYGGPDDLNAALALLGRK